MPSLSKPARDLNAGGSLDGQHDLFVLLLLVLEILAAAPGAGAAVVLLLRSCARIHADAGNNILAQHGLICHLMGQLVASHIPLHLFRRDLARHLGAHGLDVVVDHLPRQRAYPAALTADRLAPGLVVLQILQLNVIDPDVLVDAALLAQLEADVHGHGIFGGMFAAGAADLRLCLWLVVDGHTVPAADRLLGGGHLHDEPVHVRNAGIDAGLRCELLRMYGADVSFAHGGMGPLGVVPLHQEAHAALHGHRAFCHVVHGLEGLAVQLVADKMLDQVSQLLVLLPPGCDLGLRDGGADLALDVLEDDVPDVARPFSGAVGFGVAGYQGAQLAVAVVQSLPVVHLVPLRGPVVVAVSQALLPQIQPGGYQVLGIYVASVGLCSAPAFSSAVLAHGV